MARSTSGNMLIYILGAIFLMGLLVVLIKGSFQEGTGIDGEKLLIRANEVQRFGSEVERGVRYILQNGYSEDDLRFAQPNTTSYGLLTDIPGRQVFSPSGGGVELARLPTDILTASSAWIFTARNEGDVIGSTCADRRCTDMMLVLPNVSKQFCTQINRMNKVENPSGDPPEDADGFSLSYYFDRNGYIFAQTLNTAGDELENKTEGCFEGGAGDTVAGRYYYYRVLHAR
jgi:hypothetical protein